jgi:hypothetical protein
LLRAHDQHALRSPRHSYARFLLLSLRGVALCSIPTASDSPGPWATHGPPSWVGPRRLTSHKNHTSHSYWLRSAFACPRTHKTPPLAADLCAHVLPRPACLLVRVAHGPPIVGWPAPARPAREFVTLRHAGLRPFGPVPSSSHLSTHVLTFTRCIHIIALLDITTPQHSLRCAPSRKAVYAQSLVACRTYFVSTWCGPIRDEPSDLMGSGTCE